MSSQPLLPWLSSDTAVTACDDEQLAVAAPLTPLAGVADSLGYVATGAGGGFFLAGSCSCVASSWLALRTGLRPNCAQEVVTRCCSAGAEWCFFGTTTEAVAAADAEAVSVVAVPVAGDGREGTTVELSAAGA